jgi:hypothetical protein
MWVSMDDVTSDANPPEPPEPPDSPGDPGDPGDLDDPDDAAALAGYATALADALVASLPGWVERSVVEMLTSSRGGATDDERAAASEAGRRADAEVGPELRRLLAIDIDAQTTTPLAVVRGAVRYPTEVLRSFGVPPVERDDFTVSQFPDDVYDLVPRSFAEIDPSLQEPGLNWGAAKAHVHLQRRRREGRR